MSHAQHLPGTFPSLWSRELLCLLAATFLLYANFSVFFRFYGYLSTLPIDLRWSGLIIGIFSAVSLVLRPIVSARFQPGVARKYLFGGTFMLMVALAGYGLAVDLLSMLAVRCLHGLAFVVLGTALLTLITERMPRERSAQAFGYLAILNLIPNTLIPPILPFLEAKLGGFVPVLLLFAAIAALAFPLAAGAPVAMGHNPTDAQNRPLSLGEIGAVFLATRASRICWQPCFVCTWGTRSCSSSWTDSGGASASPRPVSS